MPYLTTREKRASTTPPLSDICGQWHCVNTFALHLQSLWHQHLMSTRLDAECVFTFVYNSDAAMMMVAQCSCNHSQLNIRSAASIQISPLDLPQWKKPLEGCHECRGFGWFLMNLPVFRRVSVRTGCDLCREWVNENAVAMTERTNDARVRSGGQHWSITNWHPTSLLLFCFVLFIYLLTF